MEQREEKISRIKKVNREIFNPYDFQWFLGFTPNNQHFFSKDGNDIEISLIDDFRVTTVLPDTPVTPSLSLKIPPRPNLVMRRGSSNEQPKTILLLDGTKSIDDAVRDAIALLDEALVQLTLAQSVGKVRDAAGRYILQDDGTAIHELLTPAKQPTPYDPGTPAP